MPIAEYSPHAIGLRFSSADICVIDFVDAVIELWLHMQLFQFVKVRCIQMCVRV